MIKNQVILERKSNLFKQKSSIEKHFPFFKCTIDIRSWRLNCKGEIPSTVGNEKYQIELKYSPFDLPSVFIQNHVIPRRKKIHVYSNGSLCLYDKKDIGWNKRSMISEITIPRIAEWIMYYELWLLTGEWEGPEFQD